MARSLGDRTAPQGKGMSAMDMERLTTMKGTPMKILVTGFEALSSRPPSAGSRLGTLLLACTRGVRV